MDFIKEISGLENLSVTAVTTSLVFLICVLYFGVLKGSRSLPGPWGLPYLGYWPFLDEETPHLQLLKFMKKYGQVYSFTIIGQLYIHLGSIKAAREVLITKADYFTNRKPGFNTLNFIMGGGVASLNGEAWKALRKFFVQALKEFGLTSLKDYMTGPMYYSMAAVVDRLKASEGNPVNISNIINIQCSGLLRRTLFSDDIEDKELNSILEDYGTLFSAFTGSRILLQGEFARRFVFPRISHSSYALKSKVAISKILLKIVKRHEETFDANNVRDVVDSYLNERKSREAKNDPTAEYFSDTSLVASLIQMVGDGILGLSTLVTYFLNALLEHPEEQDKIYKDLEEVVGPNRNPTIEDKNKLLYTNAFMLEVLRCSDFVTLFPGVECTQETTIHGYKIPKGAVTLINFWACHRDLDVYENSDQFRPSRFLSEAGEKKPELPILFGIGKRSCVGESYTMTQAFLILVTIIKNFQLSFFEDCDKKSILTGDLEVCAIQRGVTLYNK